MPGEVQYSYLHGATSYFEVRNSVGQIWNTNTLAFESYLSANFSSYFTSSTEQGVASAFFVGTFPAAIGPGDYGITAKGQIGGSPAETDPTVAVGDIQWNGTSVIPLSSLATSGQVSQLGPIKLARGVGVPNFQFYLVSSADHVTPFTSGICSGQIRRDAGSFVPLQSGIFAEAGLGFYSVTITSGDILCNTAALLFTANGVSGGASDPRAFSFVMQLVSGYS